MRESNETETRINRKSFLLVRYGNRKIDNEKECITIEFALLVFRKIRMSRGYKAKRFRLQ